MQVASEKWNALILAINVKHLSEPAQKHNMPASTMVNVIKTTVPAGSLV
jgi:hypothetical protein